MAAAAIVNIGSGSWKNKSAEPERCTPPAKSAMQRLHALPGTLTSGRDNIRVNCVVPGWTMTERQVSLWVDAAGEAEMDKNH